MVYPEPLMIRVTGRDGAPRAALEVEWDVVSGGGRLDTVSVLTDSMGMARAIWTLGPVTGEQAVEARIKDAEPIRFSTRATPGTVIVAVWTDLSEDVRASLPSDTMRIHAVHPETRTYIEAALAEGTTLAPRARIVPYPGLDQNWLFHFDPVGVRPYVPTGGIGQFCWSEPLLTQEEVDERRGDFYCPDRLQIVRMEDVPDEYVQRLAGG